MLLLHADDRPGDRCAREKRDSSEPAVWGSRDLTSAVYPGSVLPTESWRAEAAAVFHLSADCAPSEIIAECYYVGNNRQEKETYIVLRTSTRDIP